MTVEEQKKKVITGVDQATADKMNGTYTPSANVTQAQANAGTALNTLQTSANNAQNNGIVSQATWDKINKPYKTSNTVQSAYETTQSLLDKITSGRTSYSDRVDEMINSIMARPDFSYDPDTDTLFQQKLASSVNAGKSAMQDTMGQAAQLTGGYGSTYATSAANQAYNDYLSQAYDSLPQYYQMARETYQMDTDNAYRKYGMLSDADDREFNRTYTAWNANNQTWQELYNQEYGQYRDSVSNALQSAGLQLNESNAIYDRLQGAYNATQNFSDSLYNREYGQYKDELSQAFNLAQMENSDYWKRYSASKSGSTAKNDNVLKDEQFRAYILNGDTDVAFDYLEDKYGVTDNDLKVYYQDMASRDMGLGQYAKQEKTEKAETVKDINPSNKRSALKDMDSYVGELKEPKKGFLESADSYKGEIDEYNNAIDDKVAELIDFYNIPDEQIDEFAKLFNKYYK